MDFETRVAVKVTASIIDPVVMLVVSVLALYHQPASLTTFQLKDLHLKRGSEGCKRVTLRGARFMSQILRVLLDKTHFFFYTG